MVQASTKTPSQSSIRSARVSFRFPYDRLRHMDALSCVIECAFCNSTGRCKSCRGDENPSGILAYWYDFLKHRIRSLCAFRTACFDVFAIKRLFEPRAVRQSGCLDHIHTIHSKEKIIPVCQYTRRIFISSTTSASRLLNLLFATLLTGCYFHVSA